MIRFAIEEAIKKIEAQREQKIAGVKERLTREKITPKNAEIDALRAKAVLELDTELNEKIVELRKEYEEKKKELIALAEKKKAETAEAVYAAELSVLTVDYDTAIAKLTAQLAEIKE